MNYESLNLKKKLYFENLNNFLKIENYLRNPPNTLKNLKKNKKKLKTSIQNSNSAISSKYRQTRLSKIKFRKHEFLS